MTATAPQALPLDVALQQAIAHHQAGRLIEAEQLYRAILQALPNHPDANYNLGVLAVQARQPASGLPHFEAALNANPNQGQYWLSYIDALIQTGLTDVARQLLELVRQRGLQGEAVETLARRLEGGAQVAKQSDTESQPAFTESRPVSPTVPQNKKPNAKSAGKHATHRGENPSPQEIKTLAALFTEGRYTEAATFAQTMTVRFPRHGFGWKVLGAVFKQMGQSADALAPMQKAALLSPNDAEALSNLGAALQDMGRLDEAEANCRRALEIKPDLAEAHRNLGSTLQDMGRLDEAEASHRRALEIKPDSADVLSNLGVTLQNMGRLDEAEAICRRALEIKPDFAEALGNLGVTLQNLGRLDEAEASYRRVLAIRPNYAQVLCNLGNTLCDLDDLRQAALVYQKALDIDPANNGLDAAVCLAILSYLDGNLEQCRSKLLACQSILAKTGFKYKNSRIYWLYLDKLLSWHQKFNQNDNQTQGFGTLYVIGESHSLSAHNVVVRYNKQEMRCTAEWISGCKQWHLGNSTANKYKHKFEAVMARLPRDSTILLFIGEIDCRHDEGIIKAWKKHPDKALIEIVQSTVDAYLGYVAAIGRRYGHRIIVAGVPAPNISDELTAAEVEQLAHLIRIFNKTLKNQTLAAGMDFLDVNALTDRGDGIASGEWHIESTHLLPSAITEAFSKHLVASEHPDSPAKHEE